MTVFHALPVIAGSLVAGSSYGLTIGRPIVQSSTWHFTYAETLQFPYPATVTWVQLAITYAILLCLGWFVHVYEYGLSSTKSRANPRASFQPRHTSSNNLNYFLVRIFGSDKTTALETLALAISIAAAAFLSTYTLSYAPFEIFLFWHALTIPVSMIVTRYFVTKQTLSSQAIFLGAILCLGVLMAAYRPNLPQSPYARWAAVISSLFAAILPFQLDQALEAPNERSEPKYESIGRGITGRATEADFWNRDSLVWLQNATLLAVAILTPFLFFSGELGHISRNCYFLNVPNFWVFLFSGGAFRSIMLSSSALYIKSTSPMNFIVLMLLIEVSQLVTLTYSTPLYSQWLAIILCLFTGIWFYWLVKASTNASLIASAQALEIKSPTQKKVLQFMMCIAVLVILLANIFEALRGHGLQRISPEKFPISNPKFNDIEDMPQGKDAYLGKRPHINAVANLSMLIEECRGTYEDLKNIYDGHRCLDFLSTRQGQYLSIPDVILSSSESESSSLDPVSISNVVNASTSVFDTCGGTIIPYHIWWTGLPTWRIELYIKSYLYTQNLACSKLLIWVNTDRHLGAMDAWLHYPRFQRFMPLISRGDIILKEWKLPPRVPLPAHLDELDKARYYTHPRKANSKGERVVADFIIRDSTGQEWVEIYKDGDEPQLSYYVVAVSDAARLIILHLYGGVYMDPDMLLLRDLRPLLLSGIGFAERWGTMTDPSAYNNGLLYIPANSTISSYLLIGGTRMGLVYHFLVLGRMLAQEGRDDRYFDENSLLKLENVFFDPVWVEIDGQRVGRCSVPYIKSFEQVFQSAPVHGEWQSFDGVAFEGSINGHEIVTVNRTLENFYRGAYAIHLHNLWAMQYEPGSWIDVIVHAHSRFFAGEATNAYGELWDGPNLQGYLDE